MLQVAKLSSSLRTFDKKKALSKEIIENKACFVGLTRSIKENRKINLNKKFQRTTLHKGEKKLIVLKVKIISSFSFDILSF